MNISNFGIARGRLTRDVAIFPNADGSRKAKLTVAVQDNYKGSDGKRGSQFINLDGFIRADKQGNGVYDIIHQGDLIEVHYTVRTNNYKDKSGKDVFDQTLQVQEIQLCESKSVTDARAQKKATGEAEPPVVAMDDDLLPEA